MIFGSGTKMARKAHQIFLTPTGDKIFLGGRVNFSTVQIPLLCFDIMTFFVSLLNNIMQKMFFYFLH